MRALLIGAAVAVAAALPAVPAAAGDDRGQHFSFRPGVVSPSPDFRFGPRSGFDRRDRRRHRDRDDDGFFYDYYRDYQGDTSWKSDSFNDWWHERPDRAYPAWVRNNQTCDRQWWGGNTLRC